MFDGTYHDHQFDRMHNSVSISRMKLLHKANGGEPKQNRVHKAMQDMVKFSTISKKNVSRIVSLSHCKKNIKLEL